MVKNFNKFLRYFREHFYKYFYKYRLVTFPQSFNTRAYTRTHSLLFTKRFFLVFILCFIFFENTSFGITADSVRQVGAGHNHTCAVSTDNSNNNNLWCWGYNNVGQLGIGNTSQKTSPVKVSLTDVASVSSSVRNTCAIKTDGTLWCWGRNDHGQLGLGSSSSGINETSPKKVSLTDVTSISLGNGYACAITTTGMLWCWGYNFNGQLGIGDLGYHTYKTSPTQVTSLMSVASVSLGDSHTCAIKTNGTLWCWGNNSHGQLGLGDSEIGTSKPSPEKVSLTDVASVSLGTGFTCAIKTDGTLWCWGKNDNGQLGLGNTTNQATPTQVANLIDVTSVSLGDSHACAKKADGTLWCWGNNSYGQLGLGDSGDGTNRTSPLQVQIADVANLSLGSRHTCAIKSDGALFCWGNGNWGQLGNGVISQSSPSEVFDGSGVSPTLCDDCCNHWNYAKLNSICYNGMSNACLERGVFTCYDAKSNPSIVCNLDKEAAPCCESQLFGFIGTDCYEENGLGLYVCDGENPKSDVKCEISVTFTPTFTPTITHTLTETPISDIVPTIDIITPQTKLPAPIVLKDERKDVLIVNLPKIHEGMINRERSKKLKYQILIRKLKRLGVKDKFYKLGAKISTYHRKNRCKFRHMDKGIYSVRYRVAIIGEHKVKYTKWSKKTPVEI